MTPLHVAGPVLIAWRLDLDLHAGGWDSGEGSFRVGGRWSSPGVRATYCAVDPSTAILEVAVHKGFDALDRVAHVLTRVEIDAPGPIRIVAPDEVPNPNWLRPGLPGVGQQRFGDALLAAHPFVAIPSVVSTHSWNIVFGAALATGRYRGVAQERFALDSRLASRP